MLERNGMSEGVNGVASPAAQLQQSLQLPANANVSQSATFSMQPPEAFDFLRRFPSSSDPYSP